jgi:hypothetical protein
MLITGHQVHEAQRYVGSSSSFCQKVKKTTFEESLAYSKDEKRVQFGTLKNCYQNCVGERSWGVLKMGF